MADEKLPEGIVEESTTISLKEFCDLCSVEENYVIDMIKVGILAPTGKTKMSWQFSLFQLQRFKKAQRLQRDLELNLPGTALSLQLLDELNELREYIKHLEHQLKLLGIR